MRGRVDLSIFYPKWPRMGSGELLEYRVRVREAFWGRKDDFQISSFILSLMWVSFVHLFTCQIQLSKHPFCLSEGQMDGETRRPCYVCSTST